MFHAAMMWYLVEFTQCGWLRRCVHAGRQNMMCNKCSYQLVLNVQFLTPFSQVEYAYAICMVLTQKFQGKQQAGISLEKEQDWRPE